MTEEVHQPHLSPRDNNERQRGPNNIPRIDQERVPLKMAPVMKVILLQMTLLLKTGLKMLKTE